MGFSDEQKDALRRLHKACAEVQQALDILLKEETSSSESTPVAEPIVEEDSPFHLLTQFQKEAIQAGVDPVDVRFAGIAPERFPNLPEEKQRRLIGDCLRFIDKVLWKYHFLLSDAQKDLAKSSLSEIVNTMGIEHEEVPVFTGF